MAMAFMLCDHIWVALVAGNDWLTCIGRIAFPIFAFMTVEGYFHTKDLKKYAKRLLFFALVSEIPFNLLSGGAIVNPVHQNVLWTFLIGIGLIWLNEKFSDRNKIFRFLVGAGSIVLGFFLGILTFCDYHYAGIITVLVFYFFRGRKLWNFIGQAFFLWYVNFEILGGLSYVLEFSGKEIFFPQQGFAVLALIPIWLYRGKQGFYNKTVKAVYYWFYPAHMFVLWAISFMMSLL